MSTVPQLARPRIADCCAQPVGPLTAAGRPGPVATSPSGPSDQAKPAAREPNTERRTDSVPTREPCPSRGDTFCVPSTGIHRGHSGHRSPSGRLTSVTWGQSPHCPLLMTTFGEAVRLARDPEVILRQTHKQRTVLSLEGHAGPREGGRSHGHTCRRGGALTGRSAATPPSHPPSSSAPRA